MKFLICILAFVFYCQIAAMQNDSSSAQQLQLTARKQKKRIYATQQTANHPSEVVIEFEDIYIFKEKPKKSRGCLAMKKSCLGCMKSLIKCLFPTYENNVRED